VNSCDCKACQHPEEDFFAILAEMHAEKKRCDTCNWNMSRGEGKICGSWPIYDCGKDGCKSCEYNAALKPKHDLTWKHLADREAAKRKNTRLEKCMERLHGKG